MYKYTRELLFLASASLLDLGCGGPLEDRHELVAASHAGLTQAVVVDDVIVRLPPVLITDEMAERATKPPPEFESLTPTAFGAASWRNLMTPVKNQGSRGTCATFSATAIAERYTGGDISEQCIVREIGGNDGAWPASRFQLLTERGAVSEAACRYDLSSSVANIPSPYAYDSLVAGQGSHAVTEYQQWTVPATAADAMRLLKEALDQGHPTTVNMIVVDNTRWFDAGNTTIELPATLTCSGVALSSGTMCAGHSVAVVGYSDADGTFLFKNSWGTGWKDGGYGRVSYAYFQRLAYGDLAGLRPKFVGAPRTRGDFNGDGKNDLMVTTSLGSFLYLGKSDGSFIENAYVRTDLPLGEVDYTPGDYNGDGRTDLLITTRSGSYVYLGKSTPGFIPDVYTRRDLTLGHVRYTPGDFNGDGRTDLVITTPSGSFVYLGKADGSFIENAYVRRDLPLGRVGFTPGDVNGDGRSDLVITTATGLYVYLGKADGTFIENTYVRDDLPLGQVQLTPGDFNGDGRTDFVLTTASGSYQYLGQTDGTLSASTWSRKDLPIGQVSFVAGDTTGDGKSDLLITTAYGSFLYQGSTVGFIADRYVRDDLRLGSVQYFRSDFNGDGRADLVITTTSGSYVYLGNSDGSFESDAYVRHDLPIATVAYF